MYALYTTTAAYVRVNVCVNVCVNDFLMMFPIVLQTCLPIACSVSQCQIAMMIIFTPASDMVHTRQFTPRDVVHIRKFTPRDVVHIRALLRVTWFTYKLYSA